MKNFLIYTLTHFNSLLNHFNIALLVVLLFIILSGVLLLLSLGAAGPRPDGEAGLFKYINRNLSNIFNNMVITYVLSSKINHVKNDNYDNLINKESDYDFDDCCCGGSCSCGCNHRVALGKKRPIVSDVPLA